MTARYIVSEYKALSWVEESTFGTDPGSGYTAMRASNISIPEMIQEMLSAGFSKSEDERGPDKAIPGAKGGKFTFDVPLRGGGGAASVLTNLMEHCGTLKTSQVVKTGLIDGGSSTTFYMTTTDCADLAVGQMVMHVPATGTKSMRLITKVITGTPSQSNTYTVNAAFSTTPSSGDTLAAMDTITPKTGCISKSFTFKVYLGQSATDRLLLSLCGCCISWKLKTTEAKKLPVVEFSVSYDNWTATESNTTQVADASPVAYPVISSKLYVAGVAADTKNIGFDPGLKLDEYLATSGANGRQNWFASESEPKIDFEPLHDSALITGMSAATIYDLLFESIKDADEAWGIAVHAAQIEKYGLGPDGKLLRAKIEWGVTDPGKADADTGNSNVTANIPKWAIGITA